MSTQSGSGGTRASLVGASLDDSHAFRDGKLKIVRTAERVRNFTVKDKERPSVSVGGAEHFGLPASYPRPAARSTSTWAGSARSRGRCRPARSSARSRPGCPACARRSQFAGEKLVSLAEGPEAGTTPGGESRVAAQAYDADGDAARRGRARGRQLVRVHRRLHRLGGARRARRPGQGHRRARAGGGVRARRARARLRRGRAQPNSRLSSGPSRTSPAATGPVVSTSAVGRHAQRRLGGAVEELPAQLVERLRGRERGRLAQRPDLAARRGRAARLEDAVDRAPRRLVGALHRRQVGVRAHVVRGEEEVGDPRHRVGPVRPRARRVDQQRLEVGGLASGSGTRSPGRGSARTTLSLSRSSTWSTSCAHTSSSTSSWVHCMATLPSRLARRRPVRDVDREDPLDACRRRSARSRSRARTGAGRSRSAPTRSRCRARGRARAARPRRGRTSRRSSSG